MIKPRVAKVVKPEPNARSFSKWLMQLNESIKQKEAGVESCKDIKNMHLVVLGESAAEIFCKALDCIDLSSSASHQYLLEYGYIQENLDLGFTRELHVWVLRNPKNVTTLKDVIPGDPNKNHITYFIGIDLGRTESIKKQLDDWIGNTIKLQAAFLEDMSEEEVQRRKRKTKAFRTFPDENLEAPSAKENVLSSLEINLGAPIIVVGARTQEFKQKLTKEGRVYEDCLTLVMAHLRAECLKIGASIFSSEKDASWKNERLINFLKSVAIGEVSNEKQCVAQYTDEHGGYAIPAGEDSRSLIQISLPDGHQLEAIEKLFNEQKHDQKQRNFEYRTKSELNDVHFIKLLKFEIESSTNYYQQKNKFPVKKFSCSNLHSSSILRKPTEIGDDPFAALERKRQVSKQQADLLRAVIGNSKVPNSLHRENLDETFNWQRNHGSRDDTDKWMNKNFKCLSLNARKREETL
jgi:hypothetical protein